MPGEVSKPHDHLFRSVFGEEQEAEAASLLQAYLPPAVSRALLWSSLEWQSVSFIDDRLRDSESADEQDRGGDRDLRLSAPATVEKRTADGDKVETVHGRQIRKCPPFPVRRGSDYSFQSEARRISWAGVPSQRFRDSVSRTILTMRSASSSECVLLRL